MALQEAWLPIGVRRLPLRLRHPPGAAVVVLVDHQAIGQHARASKSRYTNSRLVEDTIDRAFASWLRSATTAV
jgi:hypothetical protein